MAKLDINKVAEVLKKNQAEPAFLRRVIEELNLLAQPDPAEGEGEPKQKKQFCVIVSDPEGKMPKADLVAWVVQIPEEESVATALERIYKGAYDFNASKRGRLHPVKTVGESLDGVPAKFFKEAVLVVVSNNEIPRDEANHVDRRREGEQTVVRS